MTGGFERGAVALSEPADPVFLDLPSLGGYICRWQPDADALGIPSFQLTPNPRYWLDPGDDGLYNGPLLDVDALAYFPIPVEEVAAHYADQPPLGRVRAFATSRSVVGSGTLLPGKVSAEDLRGARLAGDWRQIDDEHWMLMAVLLVRRSVHLQLASETLERLPLANAA